MKHLKLIFEHNFCNDLIFICEGLFVNLLKDIVIFKIDFAKLVRLGFFFLVKAVFMWLSTRDILRIILSRNRYYFC